MHTEDAYNTINHTLILCHLKGNCRRDSTTLRDHVNLIGTLGDFVSYFPPIAKGRKFVTRHKTHIC